MAHQRILAHKWTNNNLELQVKWMLGDVTWEPLSSCKDLEALDVYLELWGAKAPQDLLWREQVQWMMGHTPWHTWIYAVTAYVTQLKRFSTRWLDNNHQGFTWTTISVHLGVLQKNQQATVVALKMNPEMDTSKTRVLLQEVAKYSKPDLSPRPGTSTGCPNLSQQHIMKDVRCAMHMQCTLSKHQSCQR